MRIMVTGGAGFIGSHIVDALAAQGVSVSVLDNLSAGSFENITQSPVNFYHGDIRDGEFVLEAVERERPGVIFHQAAQANVQRSLKNPAEDAEINIIGTINLLEAARKCGVGKIIYASSAAVYGIPRYLPVDEDHPVFLQSGYGISKYTVEHYLGVYKSLYNLDFTALRYANVYGPRQNAGGEGGVVAIFLDRVLKGEAPLIFGDGEQTRDFIYVKDVVAANLSAINKGGGMVINVGTGLPTTVNRLFEIIVGLAGKEASAEYMPPRAGDIRHSRLANGLAARVLNWSPGYDLHSGIKETLLWDSLV